MADPRSVRLIFRYDGDQVELLSRQPVDMVSPPSGPLGEFADRLGTWVEVRDGQDSALHRQILSDPVRASAEVFSPEPEENLSRVERTRRTGRSPSWFPTCPRPTTWRSSWPAQHRLRRPARRARRRHWAKRSRASSASPLHGDER